MSNNCMKSSIDRDTLSTICCSGLTRLLDIDNLDEVLECDNDSWNHKRNLSKNLASALKKKSLQLFNLSNGNNNDEKVNKKGKVFGVNLNEENLCYILPLFDFLNEHAHKEGIFRVSGNKRRIAQLKEVIDSARGNVHEELTSGDYTPFDVGDLLKNYLKELPHSFLPERHYMVYLKAAELEDHNKKLEALQLLLLLLPPENRETLCRLFALLKKISEVPSSKMDAYNLAVVFAPNLINCGKDIAAEANDVELFTSVLTFLIGNHPTVLQIPNGISAQIHKYMQKVESGEKGDVLADIAVPSSAKRSSNYETETQQQTANALTQLLEQIKQIPDEAQRNAMLKKFEKYHVGTPLSATKSSGLKANATPSSAYKSMRTTPKRKAATFRTPQSAMAGGLRSHSTNKAARGLSTPVVKSACKDTGLDTPKMSKFRNLRQGSFYLPKRIKLAKEKENCGVPV